MVEVLAQVLAQVLAYETAHTSGTPAVTSDVDVVGGVRSDLQHTRENLNMPTFETNPTHK